jgi:hypothetical protein
MIAPPNERQYLARARVLVAVTQRRDLISN